MLKRNFSSTCVLPAILYLLFIAFCVPDVHAQPGPNNEPTIYHGTSAGGPLSNVKIFKGRRVSISSEVPVTVIDREEIQQIFTSTLPNLRQIVTYTPQGVMKNTQTNLDLRGLGNETLILVNNTRYGYNPKASMVYSQTLVRDPNNVPINSIEQIEIIKDPSNVQYGSNTVSGAINFNRSTGLDARFTNNVYNPYYQVPQIDYENFKNIDVSSWKTEIDAGFLRGAYSSKTSDATYGSNGWMTLEATMNGDFLVNLVNFYDKNNNLRQSNNIELYPEYYSSTETKYYGCDGKIDFSAFNYTDQNGYLHDLMRIKFTDGVPSSGAFLPDSSCDQSFQQYYNPQSDVFGSPADIFKSTDKVEIKPFGYYNSPLPGRFAETLCDSMQSYMASDTSDDYNRNIITVGINFRFEDFGGKRESFPGANVSYTRFFKDWVGATADLGLNFGKIGNTKYTIGSYFAGPTFVPFNAVGINEKFTFSVHTLGGYTGVTTKYTGGSNSNGNFSLKLGLRADFNFTKNLGIYLGGDDYMVLGKGFTSNNYAVSLGARLGLR